MEGQKQTDSAVEDEESIAKCAVNTCPGVVPAKPGRPPSPRRHKDRENKVLISERRAAKTPPKDLLRRSLIGTRVVSSCRKAQAEPPLLDACQRCTQ
jgi:hypothetical protein